MNVKLLTVHHLEFLSLKGGCTGSSESLLLEITCHGSYVTCRLRHFILGLDEGGGGHWSAGGYVHLDAKRKKYQHSSDKRHVWMHISHACAGRVRP